MFNVDKYLWDREMLSEPGKSLAKLGVFFYRDVTFVSQRVRRN